MLSQPQKKYTVWGAFVGDVTVGDLQSSIEKFILNVDIPAIFKILRLRRFSLFKSKGSFLVYKKATSKKLLFCSSSNDNMTQPMNTPLLFISRFLIFQMNFSCRFRVSFCRPRFIGGAGRRVTFLHRDTRRIRL